MGDERATSWQRGRLDLRPGPAGLLFGRMLEDPRIEAAVVPRGAPVFAVASAGCTALSLAALGHEVTAVDVNPAQVAYLSQRRGGAPPREGLIDRRLALGRRRLRQLGADEGVLAAFLASCEPAAQAAMWAAHPDGPSWRAALGAVLGAILAGVTGHGGAGDRLAGASAEALLRRVAGGLARHPNRQNPFAWRLLLGREPPTAAEGPAPPAMGPITAHAADAITFLEAGPPHRYGAFSLSNLGDVLPEESVRRLRRAVARAARPGAVLIMRSLAEPRTEEAAAWAARDRSLLWGAIEVSAP